MPTLETTAGPIAYDMKGGEEHAKATIVLLPSGAHDHHDFDELRALLPQDVRTISLDWPAHGQSPPSNAPGTAMHFADVAEQLIEQLPPSGAIVLGHSVCGFA